MTTADEPQPEPESEPEILPPESVPPVSAEDLVDGEVIAEEPVEEERRYPSTIGGAFYLAVLGVVTAAMLVVVGGDWRAGVRVMGGAVVFAALVRLVLPPRDAGMLAVRHKALDAVVLAGLGTALLVLATSIPDQPGL